MISTRGKDFVPYCRYIQLPVRAEHGVFCIRRTGSSSNGRSQLHSKGTAETRLLVVGSKH